MSAQLVLQLTALSNASLEPDEDALGDIKGISTAGQIPYEDSRRKPLFVMEVEVRFQGRTWASKCISLLSVGVSS